MLTPALKKLLHMVLVLLVVSVGVTSLLDLTPGDPAYAILGEQATAQQAAQLHRTLGLDNPFYVRYWDWLKGLLHGDFGTSYLNQTGVFDLIVQALPVTVELVLLGFIIAIVISVPIGIYCGYRADGVFDRIWAVISSALISFPPFVSALVLSSIFALSLRNFPIRFPVTGWVSLSSDLGSNLWHAFLPALALALVLIPVYSRLLRADMVDTLQEDYILAARAKGLSTRRIILVHALRQSSFSLITVVGISLGQLISGAAVVEVIFALPGLGQLIVNAITAKDIPVVQGAVMFIAVAYVFLNAAVDIAYSCIDPRVRIRNAR